jgi:hypothetical protein
MIFVRPCDSLLCLKRHGETYYMPKSQHKIVERVREIEVVHETEVLVVGSGPGGLAWRQQ